MITTNKFELSKKEFSNILIKRTFQKRGIFFVVFALFATAFWFLNTELFIKIYLTVFALLYPLIIIWRINRVVNPKLNPLLLMERYFEIDQEKINVIYGDNNSSFSVSQILKVSIINDVYMLYLSKTSFLYIPKSAFKSENDHKWFVDNIVKLN